MLNLIGFHSISWSLSNFLWPIDAIDDNLKLAEFLQLVLILLSLLDSDWTNSDKAILRILFGDFQLARDFEAAAGILKDRKAKSNSSGKTLSRLQPIC